VGIRVAELVPLSGGIGFGRDIVFEVFLGEDKNIGSGGDGVGEKGDTQNRRY
jgi:hypothetical protein